MSSLQKFHRRTQPFAVNTLHTGTVSISGTASVGSTLSVTSTIADADGLGTFAYQWNRTGAAISGATSSTYTLVSADVGNTITVKVTYTDGKGFIETATSGATASVIIVYPTVALGSGNNSIGYCLGASGSANLYVAPKSTETLVPWGSYGTIRGTTSRTDGLANTNTLYAFGSAAHPAAYYCKTLATGGYNTWYLPAMDELITMNSNQSKTPFATANSFATGQYTYSSTESTSSPGTYAQGMFFATGSSGQKAKGRTDIYVRAVRRAV